MPGEKFLSPKEIKEKAQGWASDARNFELGKRGYAYGGHDNVQRKETMDNEKDPDQSFDTQKLEILHDTSFLNKEIPEIIKRKKPGEKLKILDVGGGIGSFTEQIRKKYPNEVIVYSTGLSKKAARKYRKDNVMGPLDRRDLKWRSVYELSDYPEFDLIIDSFGEQWYTVDRNIVEPEDGLNNLSDYLTVISKKLLPHGIASIATVTSTIFGFFGEDQDERADNFARHLSKELGVALKIKRVAASKNNNFRIHMEKLDSVSKEKAA